MKYEDIGQSTFVDFEEAFNAGYGKGFAEAQDDVREFVWNEVKALPKELTKDELLKEIERICYVEKR